MAAKRKSRSTAKPTRKQSTAAEMSRKTVENASTVPDGLAVPPEITTPAEPVVADAPDVPDVRGGAPKGGPPARGRGGFTGVGRGRGAAPARQYAFRRS